MTFLETKYLNLAREIILKSVPKDKYAVFLFGSRANGKSKKTSDIDIGIYWETPFPRIKKIIMEEELEESNIPYYVDIIDFNDVSEEFKKVALQWIVVWSNPKNFAIK